MNKELVEKMRQAIYNIPVTMDLTMETVFPIAEICAAVASEHYGDKWTPISDPMPKRSPLLSEYVWLIFPQGAKRIGYFDYRTLKYYDIEGRELVTPTHFAAIKSPAQPPQQ